MCREPVCFDCCKIIVCVVKVKHNKPFTSSLFDFCLKAENSCSRVNMYMCSHRFADIFPFYLFGRRVFANSDHNNIIVFFPVCVSYFSVNQSKLYLYNALGSSSTPRGDNGLWADHVYLTVWRPPHKYASDCYVCQFICS